MNVAIDNVYAIILAAGSSSRMGNPKQLLEWHNRPLLAHALTNIREILHDRVIVVLGAHAELIQTSIDLGDVTSIVNSQWQEGMASSIRVGIKALPTSATAVLIMLCDQPLINAEHIQNLLSGWQHAPTLIAVSEYHQSVGVPVVFPAEFFTDLLALKGVRGAKPLILDFKDRLLKIPLPEAEVDIDKPEDFEFLINQY
jgi:molybdenum cofactor cytidylyltransferase